MLEAMVKSRDPGIVKPPAVNSCKICGYSDAGFFPDSFFPEWHCPRCGVFDYDTTVGWREIQSADEKVRLSGWVREQNAAGIVPVRITPDISRRIVQMRLPGLRERASHVLSLLARDYPPPNGWFVIDTIIRDVALQGRSYSRDEREIHLLIEILFEDDYLKGHGATAALSTKGFLAAEALGASKSTSVQVSLLCGLTTQ
jgi:hypothetical protein